MNDMPADKLEDVLAPGLRVIFCGSAVGNRSASEKRYYVDPTNKFWKTLQKIGLTPTQLKPEEYARVLEYGIGLTDMAKKHSGVDAQIPAGAFDPDEVRRKVMLYEPQLLAFNGKKAASVFYGLPDTDMVSYGPQEDLVGKTQVWVLPSTSGGNGHWDEGWWRKLAVRINEQQGPA
jgi:TDG/mug DNA glycosylase family protein